MSQNLNISESSLESLDDSGHQSAFSDIPSSHEATPRKVSTNQLSDCVIARPATTDRSQADETQPHLNLPAPVSSQPVRENLQQSYPQSASTQCRNPDMPQYVNWWGQNPYTQAQTQNMLNNNSNMHTYQWNQQLQYMQMTPQLQQAATLQAAVYNHLQPHMYQYPQQYSLLYPSYHSASQERSLSYQKQANTPLTQQNVMVHSQRQQYDIEADYEIPNQPDMLLAMADRLPAARIYTTSESWCDEEEEEIAQRLKHKRLRKMRQTDKLAFPGQADTSEYEEVVDILNPGTKDPNKPPEDLGRKAEEKHSTAAAEHCENLTQKQETDGSCEMRVDSYEHAGEKQMCESFVKDSVVTPSETSADGLSQNEPATGSSEDNKDVHLLSVSSDGPDGKDVRPKDNQSCETQKTRTSKIPKGLFTEDYRALYYMFKSKLLYIILTGFSILTYKNI